MGKKSGDSPSLGGPQIFRGLSDKRMQAKAGGFANSTRFKRGETVVVQFLHGIDDFLEFYQHQFQDGGWKYVPCGGDNCPLCEDDDPQVSKQNYRFSANVWNFGEGRVEILEGPKTLATTIASRCRKNPESFTKRTWEVSKLDTQPVSYDVDRAETEAIDTKKLTPYDLSENLMKQFSAYFGDQASASALVAEHHEEASNALDDKIFSKNDLKSLSDKDLKKVADSFGIAASGSTRKEVVAAILSAQG